MNHEDTGTVDVQSGTTDQSMFELDFDPTAFMIDMSKAKAFWDSQSTRSYLLDYGYQVFTIDGDDSSLYTSPPSLPEDNSTGIPPPYAFHDLWSPDDDVPYSAASNVSEP